MEHNRKPGRPRTPIIVGQQFNHWTVIGEGLSSGRDVYYPCRCKCGKTGRVSGHRLKTAISCGCVPGFFKHGMSKTKEFMVWGNMIARCENSKHRDYQWYGGRGVKVCERWRNSFQNFIDDMGRRPADGMEIDRRETNGDYCPDNCRWVTSIENKNNMRNNRMIEFNGETMNMTQWSKRIGIPYSVLCDRLGKCKWPVEKAMTTPHKPKMIVSG